MHNIAMLELAILPAEAAKINKKKPKWKTRSSTKTPKKNSTSQERETTQYLRKDGGTSNKVGSAKQALVMEIVGVISLPNCDFTATVNATAVCTNWESTTKRAINYSFYVILTCLTQIVVLLLQLLHSQAQSAAMQVSLLSIGWQTVLDALLCLGHISLSLAMQPLFTAFTSVAFFKLLIFCIIEMKHMATIMQARNGGNNTSELLCRQVTMLHLQFYIALMGVLMLFFYAGEDYSTSKYSARFMIPARFLPPKFDYSPPIPESLLPPGATQTAESKMSPFTEDPLPPFLPPVTEVICDL